MGCRRILCTVLPSLLTKVMNRVAWSSCESSESEVMSVPFAYEDIEAQNQMKRITFAQGASARNKRKICFSYGKRLTFLWRRP